MFSCTYRSLISFCLVTVTRQRISIPGACSPSNWKVEEPFFPLLMDVQITCTQADPLSPSRVYGCDQKIARCARHEHYALRLILPGRLIGALSGPCSQLGSSKNVYLCYDSPQTVSSAGNLLHFCVNVCWWYLIVLRFDS